MTEQAEIPPGSRVSPGPHGLLVVDKPPGPTSFDIIRFLRKTCSIGPKWKIGHLGTLDPFATGVVLVVLGQAVKYAEYAHNFTKCYRARLWLGEETDTLDPTGRVVKKIQVKPGWETHLESIRKSLIGKIIQTPPAYSAKKVDGERAFNLARRGESPDIKPVEKTIYKLEFIGRSEQWLDFTCEVSPGTYIRSLGQDIARRLGTVGHLIGLERTAVGPFTRELSIPFEAFEVGGIGVLMHHLHPIDPIVEHLPPFTILPPGLDKLAKGRELTGDDFMEGYPDGASDGAIVRIIEEDGLFRSLGRIRSRTSGIIPFKPWWYDKDETE
jgi:tRNA pseudouridine55 synthase